MKTTRHRSILTTFTVLLALIGGLARSAFAADGASPGSDEVLVSAAVSLKAALDDAKAGIRSPTPGDESDAEHGRLRRAPRADRAGCARGPLPQRLARTRSTGSPSAGKVLAETRTELASNRLVIALGAGREAARGVRRPRPRALPAHRDRESEDGSGRALREGGLHEARALAAARAAPRVLPRTSGRSSTTSPAAKWTRASSTGPTSVLLPGKIVEGPRRRVDRTLRSGIRASSRPRRLIRISRVSSSSSWPRPRGRRILASHGFLPPARP